INNLDKTLHYCDSSLASIIEGHVFADKLKEFASRGDGRVETDNKYAQFLKGYYHRQAKMEMEAIRLVREKYNADNLKKLQEANEKRNTQNANEVERYARNWQEEYQTNLKEAYRQLGYLPAPPPSGLTNNGVVTNSGWNNVDRYVAESVTNRTTLDYTDKDGNRAVIRYEPIHLEIANAAEFDRVLVYMPPNDLYSFRRLKKDGDHYSETLNELYEYDVLCIGFKGDENFIHHIKKAQPKNYGKVKLKRINKMALEKKLYAITDYSVQRNLKEDLAHQKFDIKEQKRMEKLMAKEQLRNEMRVVVFPCSPQFFTEDSVVMEMSFEVVDV
ncbi:MAG: hypothetical protein JKX84_04165, partial [Flavobacteriales bacterium]|nr:hypothetical protein [Flavobacteriales bacterium]